MVPVGRLMFDKECSQIIKTGAIPILRGSVQDFFSSGAFENCQRSRQVTWRWRWGGGRGEVGGGGDIQNVSAWQLLLSSMNLRNKNI